MRTGRTDANRDTLVFNLPRFSLRRLQSRHRPIFKGSSCAQPSRHGANRRERTPNPWLDRATQAGV